MKRQNRTRSFITIISFAFIASLIGCDKIPFFKKTPPPKVESPPKQIEGTLLAKVNDEAITLEDFNKRIDNIKKISPEVKIDKFEDKKAFLNELIRRELLYQEALAKGLDKKQEVVDAIEEFQHEVLAAQLIDQETADVIVESKEIEDYYNTFKDEFTSPEERRIREIIVSDESKAREILIELLKGQNFASLAMTNSISQSAKDGGDIGFIKKQDKPGRFGEIAFSLGVGEISNVFKVTEGYAIIKVEEKKGGESKSLSEAWSDIETGLLRLKKYQDVLKLEDDLRSKARLELHEDLLR